MSDAKSTKLSIHEDRPTGLASSSHGSNVNAMGFNLLFIAARNPKLAIEIMRLYAEARKLQENDPPAPQEDYALFAEEVHKTLADNDK
jgi:hypothetical protein